MVDPPGRLYPRVSGPWIVIGAIVALAAGAVLLLVTAGEDAPEEERGDLTYLEGSVPKRRARRSAQLVASIADITEAEVTSDAEWTLFEATLAAPVPEQLKSSRLELRWDLLAEPGRTWTLSVAVDKKAQASLFSDEGYGAGTVDDTFPGDVTIKDSKVEVRLNRADITDFPEEFNWSLATTLRAFRDESDSPRVEDHYPDEGSQDFTG